jgi:VanZ family protein
MPNCPYQYHPLIHFSIKTICCDKLFTCIRTGICLLTINGAALDETYQMSVPGRYSSLTVMATNTLGALMAVGYAGLRSR